MARRGGMLVDVVGEIGPSLVRAWFMSLRWRIMGGFKDRVAHRDARGPVIWAFWHSQQLFAAYIGRNRNIRILISRHRDGDYVAGVARGLGLVPVRGSSSHGGAEALLELVRESHGHDVAFTPDGPRGPREIVQPGVIAAARLTGMPIMPVGAAAWPRLRAKSWDGFVLPAPGAVAAITIGNVFRVPPDADREACEQYRLRLETEMRLATERAEQVAREFRPARLWSRHHHPYSSRYDEQAYSAP